MQSFHYFHSVVGKTVAKKQSNRTHQKVFGNYGADCAYTLGMKRFQIILAIYQKYDILWIEANWEVHFSEYQTVYGIAE